MFPAPHQPHDSCAVTEAYALNALGFLPPKANANFDSDDQNRITATEQLY